MDSPVIRRVATLAAVLAVTSWPSARAQIAPSYGSVIESYSTERIAKGVYAFIAPTSKGSFVNSNSMLVVGQESALVVDSGNVLPVTRRIIAESKRLTDRPVRYLVNTHWHWDHTLGNSEYRAAFPGLSVITTTMTRDLAGTSGLENIASMVKILPGALDTMREALKTGRRQDGTSLLPQDREFTESQVAGYAVGLPQYQQLHYVPPALTFDHEMTVELGGREVKLMFLGRGNTAGDAVIVVPSLKVVATGDLVVAPTPYASDSFYFEWPATMRKLMQIDAAAILPGHGPVMHDWSYAKLVTDLLDATLAQVQHAVAEGLSLEEARKKIDLGAFRARFANGDPFMIRMFDQAFTRSAIDRAYAEVTERTKK
jgi:cyclase